MEKLLQGTLNEEINSIKQEIERINIDCRKINPEKLEKDEDLNGHVDFIYSCSNIRTRNYNIKEIEKQKLKMIAGRTSNGNNNCCNNWYCMSSNILIHEERVHFGSYTLSIFMRYTYLNTLNIPKKYFF